MIKEKKGVIRIIEAFIAIMLIAGALIFVYTSQIERPKESDTIYKLETIVLEKIAYDDDLRSNVLNSYLYFNDTILPTDPRAKNHTALNRTIGQLLSASLSPTDYTFLFQICNIEDICGLPHSSDYYTKNDIYAKEKSISATLGQYNPRKIRLFVYKI